MDFPTTIWEAYRKEGTACAQGERKLQEASSMGRLPGSPSLEWGGGRGGGSDTPCGRAGRTPRFLGSAQASAWPSASPQTQGLFPHSLPVGEQWSLAPSWHGNEKWTQPPLPGSGWVCCWYSGEGDARVSLHMHPWGLEKAPVEISGLRMMEVTESCSRKSCTWGMIPAGPVPRRQLPTTVGMRGKETTMQSTRSCRCSTLCWSRSINTGSSLSRTSRTASSSTSTGSLFGCKRHQSFCLISAVRCALPKQGSGSSRKAGQLVSLEQRCGVSVLCPLTKSWSPVSVVSRGNKHVPSPSTTFLAIEMTKSFLKSSWFSSFPPFCFLVQDDENQWHPLAFLDFWHPIFELHKVRSPASAGSRDWCQGASPAHSLPASRTVRAVPGTRRHTGEHAGAGTLEAFLGPCQKCLHSIFWHTGQVESIEWGMSEAELPGCTKNHCSFWSLRKVISLGLTWHEHPLPSCSHYFKCYARLSWMCALHGSVLQLSHLSNGEGNTFLFHRGVVRSHACKRFWMGRAPDAITRITYIFFLLFLILLIWLAITRIT